MDDALERMVDPTVLLPVVLLVVAEFGTLARDLDLQEAVAEERPPLVVDFVIHGGLTYLKVAHREVTETFAPLVAVATQPMEALELPNRPAVPDDVRSIAEVARPILLPNLGQFAIVHLTNTGLLVFAFAATASGSKTGFSFVQHLLVFVVAVLPLLEVGEYENIQEAVEPVYSLAVHLGVNVNVVIISVAPPPFLDGSVATSPAVTTPAYLTWWLAAGYLYLVVLAVDIRRMENEE